MIIFLKGNNNIYLRPLESSETGNYLSWVNDPEVTKYMETGTFPTAKEQLESYYTKVINDGHSVMFAIVVNIEGTKSAETHIGNIKLDQINWINRTACLGIMIGDKDYWGKGIGTEACKLVVNYAFNTLNLHKVWLGVVEEHTAAIKVYEKTGFVREALLTGEIFKNGTYHNKVIMSIFSSEISGWADLTKWAAETRERVSVQP